MFETSSRKHDSGASETPQSERQAGLDPQGLQARVARLEAAVADLTETLERAHASYVAVAAVLSEHRRALSALGVRFRADPREPGSIQ